MYYHGTTSNVVDSILRNGLRPTPQNKWHITVPNQRNGDYKPDVEDDDFSVYLTDSPLSAAAWAYTKAKYLRLLPGRTFRSIGFNGEFIKDTNAPLIDDVTPVILEVRWNGEVYRDHKTPTDPSNVFTRQNIPARFIAVFDDKGLLKAFKESEKVFNI